MKEVEIIVRLDVMLALRKMKSRDLAQAVGITEQNISLLKSGKVKGIRFDTLAKICAVLECLPGDLLDAVEVTKDHRPDIENS
jgi:putative transcriptional regulator